MRKQKLKGPARKPSTDQNKIESNKYVVPAAFGVMGLAIIVLFSEFLFSDKMLYGSDMLSAGIFFRGFYVDFVTTNWAVPQWNPYIFGGLPFVDAFHGDLYYPLSIMKFFGDLHRMLGWVLVIHIFSAGLAMYFCAKQFKLSKIPSLMAAASYMFAPYLVSLVAPGHDGKIFVTALFPLSMLFLDRGFDSKSWIASLFNFSIMGLVIGLIILTPHAQMSYFTLWALGAFTSYRLIAMLIEKRSIILLLRPAALAAFAVVIGLGLSAIQFYPGYNYTTEFSPRADTKSGWDWATSWSMHEEETLSLLIPEFSGVSSRNTNTSYWGKNAFKDNSESVGVVALFLALIGLFFSRQRHRYFLGGMALLSLLYALGATTPIFSLFYFLIPKVSSLRAPSMIMFLFSFSIALLAGMCLQSVIQSDLLQKRYRRKFSYLLIGFPGLLFLLALIFGMNGQGALRGWTSIFYSEAARTAVAQGVTKMDLANANLSSIQSGAWWAFLFVAAVAIVIWMYQQGKVGIAAIGMILLFSVVNDVRFDKRFVSTIEPGTYWDSNPVSDFFQRQPGHFRVMNFTRAVPENFLPQFGISIVTGYHGNQLRWYDKLLGGPGAPEKGNPNLLNLVGAKYLLVPANQQLPAGYFGSRPVTEAANFGSVRAILNENALPRVYLAGKYRLFANHDDIAQAVLNGTNDFRSIVYLEQEPEIELTADSGTTDTAWIMDYQTDSVVVGVNLTGNKLLVLTDNYYDAWQVFVDDKPAKLLRAYGSFRAVELSEGAKTVRFIYESERFHTGQIITFATSLYLFLVIGLYFVFRNRFRSDQIEESSE